MLRDNQTLLDLAKSSRLVLQFTQGTDKTEFLENEEKQSAILYRLIVLGEAVKRLSRDFRAQHPEVPWSSIAGMRDILTHEYDRVDLELVWSTAIEDIPVFLAAIAPLLPQESD